VSTLRAAGQLLTNAVDFDGLAGIAASVGCGGAAEPLDDDALRTLGIDDSVVEARVAAGVGALRALLLRIRDDLPIRNTLSRIASRLSTRAPHVLWLVIGDQWARGDVAIAAWSGDKRPRVAALVVNRGHVVASDAETLRTLATAAGPHDVLTHARWVEVLGRDALTGRFYRALEQAVNGIAASSSIGNDAVRGELALLDASRLLFLAFLEAKGWLSGDRAFLAHTFERCMERHGRFRQTLLRPLFFGTLNTPVRRRAPAARAFGRIPFLNGGLFAGTPLERANRSIVFSDDAYGSLIYDVFGQFRFTAREESADWSEAAVDPEMLGRAFESLMANRERRRTGAFFTPFSLVEHLSAQALEARLGAWVAGDVAALPLARRAEVRGVLSRLTVLDPACGSGAFLVHMLERLASLHAALGDERDVASIRRDVLTRSIFGVDVNPVAAWLCGLRLWLSVVIESADDDITGVLPLPNLDRNIRVGDALARAAHVGLPALTSTAGLGRLRTQYARASGARKATLARRLESVERRRAIEVIDAELATLAVRRRDLVVAQRGRDLFGDRYRTSRDERQASRDLRARASELRAARRRIVAGGALPFSFDVHFADVAAKGGFDVVTGNPPWVRVHHIGGEQRLRYRQDFEVARQAAWEPGATLAGAGAGFAAQIDAAALFVERSIDLLAANGVAALLLPAKLWRSLAGGGVRRLVTRRTSLVRIEDHSDGAAAFDAAVYPSCIVLRRGDVPACEHIDVVVHRRNGTGVSWKLPRGELPYDATPGAPWLMLPRSVRRGFDALREAGQPFADSPLGRPRLGVKCGCNDAFVVRLIERDGDRARVVGRDGTSILIESHMLRPLLRGERLREWKAAGGDEFIIWTHDERDRPRAQLPPLARSWLGRWRPSLQARADGHSPVRWWGPFRTEAASDDRPRLVWGDVGRAPRALVLSAGDDTVPLNSCYVARCRNLPDANVGAALLNSVLVQAWLHALAEPARGGYKRFLGWTLALLPVPSDWLRARDILAPLAAAARDGHPPTDIELLEACLTAYGINRSVVAPLVAWSAE
jgi:hypothetical protein